MKTYRLISCFIALLLTGSVNAFAQNDLRVPLSNPGEPGVLKVNAVFADDVYIYAHSEKDIRIVIDGEEDEEYDDDFNRNGLKRISRSGTGVEVSEKNNVVSVQTASNHEEVELEIYVPERFSVMMQITHGDVYVEGLIGEHEIKATNGDVELVGVGGSCVVNSVNGDIDVDMKSVFKDAPMSFTGLNGDLTVSLPADVKFNGKMKTDFGDVYTNFEINLDRSSSTQEVSRNDGTYSVVVNKWITGTVNGGGPEYLFKTMHGDIEIRKN